MTSQRITAKYRFGARLLQTSIPLFTSLPKELKLLSASSVGKEHIWIPTRYGDVHCIVYRTLPDGPDTPESLPPVYVEFHGGAFIVRNPEQDDHLCRHIAAEASCVVVSVDYDTAPLVQYPVAEHEAYDVVEWIFGNGADLGVDGRRIAVGGMSAGSKLAVNVCQQAHIGGSFMPVGLVSGYGITDMTLEPSDRRSPKKVPHVTPWLIDIIYRTYFVDAVRRSEPLASPGLDEDLTGFPPTLVLTAGLDSLAAESDRFASRLAGVGIGVTHQRFPGVDHGFTHAKPTDVALKALNAIVGHLTAAFGCT